ncbi:MAG: hypothetical protein AAGF04_05615 [Chlamydiota bacterium]
MIFYENFNLFRFVEKRVQASCMILLYHASLGRPPSWIAFGCAWECVASAICELTTYFFQTENFYWCQCLPLIELALAVGVTNFLFQVAVPLLSASYFSTRLSFLHLIFINLAMEWLGYIDPPAEERMCNTMIVV